MSKKFERIVIHCGASKAGSTAIQETFHRWRGRLLKAGLVAYPPGTWHPLLGSYFAEDPKGYIYNVLEEENDDLSISERDEQYFQFFDKWVQDCSSCKVLLISYEGFCDLSALDLANMAGYLSRYSDVVDCLYYVRGPVSYARSTLSQRAKNGFPMLESPGALVWPAKTYLNDAIIAFGKEHVIVRHFDRKALVGGDLINDICDVLGIDNHNLIDENIRYNKSLSNLSAQLCERISRYLKIKDIHLTPTEFYQIFSHNFEDIAGEPIKLNEYIGDFIAKNSTQHNDYIKDNFDIDILDFDGSEIDRESYEKNNILIDNIIESLFPMLSRQLPVPYRIKESIENTKIEDEFIDTIEVTGPLSVARGKYARFDLQFNIKNHVKEIEVGMHIRDSAGALAFGTNSTLLDINIIQIAQGRYKASFHFIADLPPGQYAIGFAIAEMTAGQKIKDLYWCDASIVFEVCPTDDLKGVGYAQLAAAIAFEPQALPASNQLDLSAISSADTAK